MEVRTVASAGLRTSCIVAGPEAAPPVVLLHGGGFDRASRCWGGVLEVWSNRFRMYAPDLPGYGDTEGYGRPHRIPELGTWLLQLMKTLEIQSAHVVGNSMGGGMALWLAFAHPDHVRRLVPVGSYGLLDRHWFHPGLWVHAQVGGSRLFAECGARSRLLAQLGLRTLFADPARITPELIDALQVEARAQAKRHSFRDFLRGEVGPTGFRTSFRGRLAKLPHETLFVHGHKDRILPIRAARYAARAAPHAALWEMQAGHWPMRERPEQFARRVGDFLECGDPGGGDQE